MDETKYINVKDEKQKINQNSNIMYNGQNKIENDYQKRKWQEKYIMIPIVVIIINLGGYSWFFYFRYSLKDKNNIKILGNIIIILYIILLLNYFLAVFTKSNVTRYEKILEHEQNNSKESILNYQKNVISEYNNENFFFCEFCGRKKFIRSSHCKICNICVLGRDHHCPWIANCVGFKNIHFFYNFLLWGIIDILSVIIFYIKFVINFNYINRNYPELKISPFKLTCLTILIVILVIVILSLLTLFSIVNYEIYNNRTQLEGTRNPNIEMFFYFKKPKPENSCYNFYNIGFLNHFYYFIGNSIFHFFFPLPRLRDYNFNEEASIFQICKQPSKLSLVRMIYGNNEEELDKLFNAPGNEPSEFLKLSHKIYDKKHIH